MRRIDPEHPGLPSVTEILGLDGYKYKNMSTPDVVILSLSPLCSTGYWIVRVTFSFAFNWPIHYLLQCLAHFRSFWNCVSSFRFDH